MIVGGGAAGFAAAEMLRRQGFRGSIIMLSSDTGLPVDRPNLSKDYLAGSAPEEWLPLGPAASTLKPVLIPARDRGPLDRYQGGTSSSQVAATFPSTVYFSPQVRSR